MTSILRSFAAALLVGSAGLASAPAAEAAAQASYLANTYANARPDVVRETTSRFRTEGKDNAGNLVGFRECSTIGAACASTIPGAVNNVVVLEIDLQREEVVTEWCRGVVSTIPQLRCENGDYQVTLRLRQGALTIRTRAEGSDGPLLGQAISGATRFEFAEDPTKFWNMSPYWTDSTVVAPLSVGYRFPAGRYKVFSPDLGKYCLPVQANPGVGFDLPADGATHVEVVYRGTECLVQVATDVDVADLTMSGDGGTFTCVAKGQFGVPWVKSVCSGRFPFNQPMRIRASVPAGQEPYFPTNTSCEYAPTDRTYCNLKPKGDYTIDNFTNISMSAKPVGVTPPPPPVALAVAKASSSPDDGLAVKGATDVPLLALQADASNGTAMLQAITLKAAGTGRDDLDLAMVRVVLDADGNGRFDAGETVLAQGRPSVDDGELRLAFGSALAVPSSARLLVVADIGGEVHAASAAAWGGGGVLLAVGCFAWPAARRRGRVAVLLVALALAATVGSGCGGSGGSEDDPVDPPVVVDPPPAPPPLPVSYRLDLIAVEATDTATPAGTLNVAALPIVGATLTVAR